VYVRVKLNARPPAVTLEELEDTSRFHLAVEGGGDARAVGEALAKKGVGRMKDSGVAFVRVDAVRRLAEGRVGTSWDGEFTKMLDYARSKGWLQGGDEEVIEAHIEWPGARR
jgi:hypothetical protein